MPILSCVWRFLSSPSLGYCVESFAMLGSVAFIEGSKINEKICSDRG